MVACINGLVLSVAAYCSVVGRTAVCLASHHQRTTGPCPGLGHYGQTCWEHSLAGLGFSFFPAPCREDLSSERGRAKPVAPAFGTSTSKDPIHNLTGSLQPGRNATGYPERPFGLQCQPPLKSQQTNAVSGQKALKKESTSINRAAAISPLLKGIAEAVFVLNSSIFSIPM